MILKRNIFIFSIILLSILTMFGCSTSRKVEKNQESTISKESSGKQSQTQNYNETGNIEKSNVTSKNITNERVEEKIISKEYKEKETESILDTIEKLEKCYETGDFEKWESLLTPVYKAKYNNPIFLKEHGWKAKDLKSFFYLLIQTREKNGIKSLPISRVEFVNPNKAYVYVLFKGKEFPKPQHTFIKIGNSWYKGLPDEEE